MVGLSGLFLQTLGFLCGAVGLVLLVAGIENCGLGRRLLGWSPAAWPPYGAPVALWLGFVGRTRRILSGYYAWPAKNYSRGANENAGAVLQDLVWRVECHMDQDQGRTFCARRLRSFGRVDALLSRDRFGGRLYSAGRGCALEGREIQAARGCVDSGGGARNFPRRRRGVAGQRQLASPGLPDRTLGNVVARRPRRLGPVVPTSAPRLWDRTMFFCCSAACSTVREASGSTCRNRGK